MILQTALQFAVGTAPTGHPDSKSGHVRVVADLAHRQVRRRRFTGKSADLPRRLSATRRPRLPARSRRHGPGRRRAGLFVQLRKERFSAGTGKMSTYKLIKYHQVIVLEFSFCTFETGAFLNHDCHGSGTSHHKGATSMQTHSQLDDKGWQYKSSSEFKRSILVILFEF